MPDNELTAFLLIGLVFVLADGQVLYRGGCRYLNVAGAGSLAWMLVTVFHLVAFGLLALLSVVGPGWSGSTAALVGRLGVFLLMLAAVHGLTLLAMARRRQDHIVEAHFQEGDDPVVASELEQATVTPVPGQDGRPPHVSPDLGDRGPYRT